MSQYKFISGLLHLIVAIITASLGIRFLMTTKFFNYHAEAAGLSWETVEPGLQIVFLAVFRICGAGILTLSMCMFIMVILPFAAYRQRWSYYAIPLVSFLFWSIVLATTLYVTLTTPGTAPWIGSLVCIVMILLAFLFSSLDRAA